MGSFNPKVRIPVSVGVHFGWQWMCRINVYFSKGKAKVRFAGCTVKSVAVKSLRLHSHLSPAVAVPHGQAGAYAEQLVPVEEAVRRSLSALICLQHTAAALSAATGDTSLPDARCAPWLQATLTLRRHLMNQSRQTSEVLLCCGAGNAHTLIWQLRSS